MKTHKYKRKQDEHKERQGNAFSRQNESMKACRRLALQYYKREWHKDDPNSWDIFARSLSSQTRKRLRYEDVQAYFPVFIRMTELLQEKERKAKFINQHFKPLESDLFTI
jgi:hypothetical protein